MGILNKLFSQHTCKICGKEIKPRYTVCFQCNAQRRLAVKYAPEQVSGHRRHDLRKSRVFHAYILKTDYGHYIGHTGNITKRVEQHQRNKVRSTAGGNPELIWQSEEFKSRYSASGYESALKAWRDYKEPKYEADTGLTPIDYENPLFGQGRTGEADYRKAALFIITIAIMGIFGFYTFLLR